MHVETAAVSQRNDRMGEYLAPWGNAAPEKRKKETILINYLHIGGNVRIAA